jgi:hypothetical protein
MSSNKTIETGASVENFINAVDNEQVVPVPEEPRCN